MLLFETTKRFVPGDVDGNQVGTGTARGSAPWVESLDRDQVRGGVQFHVPSSWLAGGSFDLRASVNLPVGTNPFERFECGGDCSANNDFTLSGVPVASLPQLAVWSLELRTPGQGALDSPEGVFSRARLWWPGGQRIRLTPYVSTLTIDPYTRTAFRLPFINPAFFVCGARSGFVSDDVTRACRQDVVDAAVRQFQTDNPGRRVNGNLLSEFYDTVFAVHNYIGPPGLVEPGFSHGNIGDVSGLTPGALPGDAPYFTVNHKGVPSAAHELGHQYTLPHAGPDCPGAEASGPQAGEPWPSDNKGRLQGVKWNLLGADPKGDRDAEVDGQGATVLFDTMSYCRSRGVNDWVSPRSWNRAFTELRSLGERVGFGARPTIVRLSGGRATARGARAAQRVRKGSAFATGAVGPGRGTIFRVTPADGDDAVPATDPSSRVRLRGLDRAGRVLGDVGVRVLANSETPPDSGGTFVGPVPAASDVVELVANGVVLDRFTRSRPPRVRLLSPRRRTRVRARRSLPVRWSASDPDGGRLNATVDYSPDGGRSWRTVFDGPSSGRARVPGRLLAGSRRARVRVSVSDGFNEASAVSRVFRADGSKPSVRILRPYRRESLQSGVRTLLIGAALDDRFLALRGRSLTWFAGRRRFGRGERIRAKLPAGRITLRLVARDHTGKKGVARLRLRVARPRLRLLEFKYPLKVGRKARTLRVRVRATSKATLRVGGRRYRVGPRRKRIVVRLPRRPAIGLVRVPFRLAPRGRGSTGRVRGRIALPRV